MKADVDKLDNPVWSKPNQRDRTELCAYGGNEIYEARGSILTLFFLNVANKLEQAGIGKLVSISVLSH
ncbi:hypothetical protein ACFL3G_11225 [Planctomycetota bacterium]